MKTNFDKRFLRSVPFVYTEDHYIKHRVLAYQLPRLQNVHYCPLTLPEVFIGSYVTVDQDELLHSYNDLPALVTRGGNLFWYKRGLLHRDNGPAVIYNSGTMKWYKEGQPYSENNRPAIIQRNGVVMWFEDGKFKKAILPSGEYTFEFPIIYLEEK